MDEMERTFRELVVDIGVGVGKCSVVSGENAVEL